MKTLIIKRNVLKSIFLCVLTTLILIFSFQSCEIGLGPAVDIAIPTIDISYPPKNAVVRDTFIVSGACDDDTAVASVQVSLFNPEKNVTYGPFDAVLSEDLKSWTISLNKSDLTKTTNFFDSYKQWEFPDGNYIINATAYDKNKKVSPLATSPISIDNTAPVLIVSKPLAIGSETATVYGRSLKVSGDIAEEHETSKFVLYYKEFDTATDSFVSDNVKSIELTDTAELNAVSSSNPLIIAKFDENNTDSEAHKRYLEIYGNNIDNQTRVYYSGFMLEDNARIYKTPGDNGSGTGNQTKQYYLLGEAFQKNLSVNYSLTAPRLMELLRGEEDLYTAEEITKISQILSTSGNFASSTALTEAKDDEQIKEQSSKYSLNPHNNPTWTLDEYGISSPAAGSSQMPEIKAYTAGSSLILSLRSGRDASYPDPKTVKAELYELGDFNSNTNYFALPITGITPLTLIDPTGVAAPSWNESADDAEKTYTFTLNTDENNGGLQANYVYRIVVSGTDRNKTDLEPEGDKVYVFKVTSSNSIPKVTITSNNLPDALAAGSAISLVDDDKVFGTAATAGNVNTDGVVITGYVLTDGISLNKVEVSDFTVKKMDGTSTDHTKADYDLTDISFIADPAGVANKYWFKIIAKAKTGTDKNFVPATESKYLYTATIKATDNGNNSGEKNVKFYVDNLPPTLVISSVSPVVNVTENGISNEYVNGKLTVTGTASDSGNTGSGLKSIAYKVTKSGSSTPKISGTIAGAPEFWSFDIKTKDYEDGEYTITLTATDVVDNTKEETKTFTLKQSTDKPEFTLSNAEKSIRTAEGLINQDNQNMFATSGNNKLYGLIKDDDGLHSVTVKYQKDGTGTISTSVTSLTSGPKEYNLEYVLPSDQGEYKVWIEAEDIYSYSATTQETNEGSLTQADSYFWIVVDNGAPDFTDVKATTNPTASGYYLGNTGSNNSQTLKITGKVTDANGLAETNRFTVKHQKKNGNNWADDTSSTKPVSSIQSPNTTGVFSDTITLPKASGTYRVIYTAKDKYGQESTAELEYMVDVVEPELDTATISVDGKTVSSDSVSGYIKDNNVTLSVNVKDTDSGLAKVEYSLDGDSTAATSWKPMVISGNSQGVPTGYENWTSSVSFADGSSKTLRLRLTDGVGLTTTYPASGDITLTVDKTAPTMELKWYQVQDNTSASELYPVSGKAYVNTKNLVIYANYTDGTDCSGVTEPEFKIVKADNTEVLLNGTAKPKPTFTYYTEAYDNEVSDAATSTTDAKLKKSFKAEIAASSFVDGDLYIKGADAAGNTIRGEWVKALSLEKDTTPPSVGAITLTKAYKKGNTYYVRNITDGNLIVTGTTTDNHPVDKTVLTVSGFAANEQPASVSDMNWSYSLDLRSLSDDTILTITAYDKAGNASTPENINIVFDENKPKVLTGGPNGSDIADRSNPFKETYTLRGKEVYKYNNIKIGNGVYSDSSYGREAQIPLTVTFIGDEATDNGSGIASIEYKMYSVSGLPDALKNTPTGKYTGTFPTKTTGEDPNKKTWPVTGNFEVASSTYQHYNTTTGQYEGSYDCTTGTATIDGFEPTTDGTPNLVFFRATDNCGNTSDWFALLVQLDDQKPVIELDSDNPAFILTNGKSTLPVLKGTVKDTGAGLNALRVYVDGTLAFTCGGKGNTNTNQTVSNDYGEMTFTANAASTQDTAPSFANSTSEVDWELRLTPQTGTWFDTIKTKSNPQITIEAEDWAQDASGNGNKNTELITSLDIDIVSPKASITSPDTTKALNGKQTIKATVEEEHNVNTVTLYYSTANTAPAALTSWTLLKTVTSVYQIEEQINLNNTPYLATNAASGKLHVLALATDKAGNTNVPTDNVTDNQSDGEKAYKTINIDKNSDRPTVTITNIDLIGNDGTGKNQALSATNYRKHETNTINFKVSDDDGISTFEYRIIKDDAAAPAENEGWESLTLTQNSGSIRFTEDGKQKVEFRITDTDSGTFTSSAANSLNRIYLKDSATTVHTYGLASGETGYDAAYELPAIFLNVDTQSPSVIIKGITALKTATPAGTETEITDGFAALSLGGPDAQYIQLKVQASDTGTGIQNVVITATLDDNPVTIENATLTSAANDGYYYFIIPCTDNETKKDNKPLSISVTAKDNVNKEASDSVLLKVDDKAPEISITAPSSSENLSGSVTAEGSITNKESVEFYYAISPIETTPDYTETQAFTFSKTNKDGVTTNNISLPTTDKAGNTITTSYSNNLKELCGWKKLDASNAKLMSLYLWLDGKTDGSAPGYHADTLNQWILNMGITTEDDLSAVSNAFDDIVQLYFHVKAVDAAGNSSIETQPIKLDPLGKRPKVNIGYPSIPEDGSTLTLGGTPTIIGTAQGDNVVDYVWLQLDCTGDQAWTAADFNKLVVLKENNTPVYTLGNMKTKQVVTGTVANNDDVANLAIRISLSGLSWSQKINLKNELYPTTGTSQASKIWVYATDSMGYTSDPEIRSFTMDKDSPLIDQNLYLVQWANGKNGSNGIDYTKTDITFVANAVSASRAYQEGLNISGKWYLVGKVSDDSNGIKNITYRVKNGNTTYDTVEAVDDKTGTDQEDYEDSTTGTYIKKITGQEKNNFIFCIPVGDATPNSVGEYSVEFSAYENKKAEERDVKRTFTVQYDNKAPTIETVLKVKDYAALSATNPLEILNSNGSYKISGEAAERDVNGVEQTGVDRIAFYFTRDITGQATKVFDPMMRSKKDGVAVNGNAIDYSSLGGLEDGLYWQSAAIAPNGIDGPAVTLSGAVPTNVHKGGLAKIAGVIYKIQAVDTTNKVVTLSAAPGLATSIKFAIANVIDNPTRESPGLTSLTSDYGYGYTSGGDYEDGDLMVEGLVPDANDNKLFVWEASINSKNISDGPVELHYVVFDKAGNASTVQTVQYCIVKNNAPRLAGVTLGTDEDGNGSIDNTEWISSYSDSYQFGYNEGNKVSSITVPSGANEGSPESVFTVKGFTQIKPEIVGGNGQIGYTYSVATYDTTNNKWNTAVDKVTTPVDLGTGTEAEEQNDDGTTKTVNLTNGGIKFTVEDFLTNGITDGDNQKFVFTIWDSTPGLAYGSKSQKATLNVIMDIKLDDTVKAQNTILPFYWKDKTKNSLQYDSKGVAIGHIELSKDLPGGTFKSPDDDGYDATTIYTLSPKISGAIKLEGIAKDNSLLSSISVKIGAGANNTIAEYNDGTWVYKSGTGWQAKDMQQATYDELYKAGYITETRYSELTAEGTGIKGTDLVPYASQEFGHVVHWTMEIDTQAMSLTPAAGIQISVSAADKGSPYKDGTGDQAGTRVPNIVSGSAVYTPNGFSAVTGQTGGNDGSGSFTSQYKIDLVPYITRIKTALSEKSKKDDTSEYDRTALGHYPVRRWKEKGDNNTEITKTETIIISGFNLGGTVKFTGNKTADYNAAGVVIPNDAKSGEISIVNGVESLNNLNDNDAAGSYDYGESLPVVADYGKAQTYQIWTNFYNRKPNQTNNYTLTDDTVLDIWSFNSNAAVPNGGGRIDEVNMKINPASTNKIIGFSFLNSFSKFATPGNGTSYTNQGVTGGQADFRSTASLAYDYRGWSYCTDAGGDEANTGNRIKLWILNTASEEQTSVIFERINQSGPRNGSDTNNVDLRYKVRSPSIATSKAEASTNTNDFSTNIYFAYYDSFNDEIRFKAGNSKTNVEDWWGNITTNNRKTLTERPRDEYSCYNSQVIATVTSAETLPAGTTYSTQYPVLGGAGAFVALDVIPKYTYIGPNNVKTNAITNDNDIVVIVWYDVAAKALKYSYNTNPLDTSWQVKNNHYCGLNSQNWAGAKTIFTGAGEYCQIKVDANGGIHIAAFDPVYGDLKYAFLPTYNADYTESTMSWTVDSSGNTGSHLVLDVGLIGNNPVPYISYWGSGMPKIAYKNVAATANGTESDMFTGNWEVSFIPTPSTINDLDQKYLNNLDNRINVALWKDTSGNITTSKSGTSTANANNGTCYGNGTSNPIVGYSIMANLGNGASDSTNDRIETAQME